MEIVYDMTGAVILRKDDGTEVDLLKLEGALTLAQRSREFNRRRVIELEDEVTRLRKILAGDGGLSDRLYTAAEVGDLQASEAELVAAPLRRLVERAAAASSRAATALFRDRVADLERQLARSIDRENKLEADAAEEREMHRRSIAARDELLAAATTRVEKARDVLARRGVTEARDAIVTSKGTILADAIGRALGFLTSPVPEQE